MKKFLFFITALTALSASVFTGCNVKDDLNGDTAKNSPATVTQETGDENDKNNFEYIPKKLNGRAVDTQENENNDSEDKPDGSCKKPKRHHREHDGELLIIHFSKDWRADDRFKPHPPLEPIQPDTDPEEPEDTDNGEN